MKILCNCGAKFAVDVTPEMVRQPIRFVCPACGLDSSDVVNQMIRQEFAPSAPAAVPVAQVVVAEPVTAAAPAPAPTVAAATATSVPARIHITRPAPSAAPPAAAAADAPQPCFKHPGEHMVHHCLVCNKPMCPKCMELFGYVCSPFCRNKAEAQKMEIPEFAGQKSVTESRLWRKVGLVTGGIVAVIALLVGTWIWYEWFGSRPKPVFTVQFAQPIRSGQSEFCGKDQLVFLHGLTLSRYDVKSKKEVWSRQLVDKARIDAAIASHTKRMQDWITEARNQGAERIPSMPPPEEIAADVERSLASGLQLFVQASNVWVTADSGKLVRRDWATGNPGQEIPVQIGYHQVSHEGDELILRSVNEQRQRVVTHINLVSGETRAETTQAAAQPAAVLAAANAGAKGAKAAGTVAAAGLPIGTPGADARKPMDPAQVAAQAQRMSLPGKIALPAVVANAMNQERIMNELDDEDGISFSEATGSDAKDRVAFISSNHGEYQLSVRLLEERHVERKVMKDPPKKSALDGNVNATQTMEVANELLNEMQRNRGGATVVEDESRYLVTVHCMEGNTPDWVGEVVGPVSLFPLKTINIVTAGATLTVLDKSNKKLWQGTLTHKVKRNSGFFGVEDTRYGEGPCVERGDRLYVCDETMLTAFDLNTGNVHWRLPSVGIVGLLFDDKGMLYVNSTTASPDNVKYSKQIDVSQKIGNVILKVDPKQGKTLWTAQVGGYISYLSGKFIYVWSSNDADGMKDSPLNLGLDSPSYVRIKRLNPKNGELMFDYYQERAPLNVKFSQNTIQILFKQELQVLKYLTF